MKVIQHRAEHSPSPAGSSYPFFCRPIFIFLLTAACVFFVVDTYRWPLLWDGQVLHYINFLINHGMAPYREIYDMNLPGAYLIDGLQLHLFGPGDLAWRFYDFFLLGCITVAMIVITLPYDWLAGLIAGVLFTLFHAAEGPGNSGQRDEIMTMFLLLGCAFLFEAVRKRRSWLLMLTGICMGWGIFIKPTAIPFTLVLILMMLYAIKQAQQPVTRPICYLAVGLTVPLIATLVFLAGNQAIKPFFEISTRLTAFYATVMPASKQELLRNSLPVSVFLLLPLGFAVALMNRDQANWEHWAIRVGIAFGFISYYIQHKGFKYHRYPFLAFLLLWLCLEFAQAVRGKKPWPRKLGFIGLFLASFVLLPLSVYHVSIVHYSDQYTLELQEDLSRLGGARLQHQVQCLDMVDGCFSALYRLGLVQNTGFTGDNLFFSPQSAPAVDYYRRIFWQKLQTNPPKVIVLSDEWFNWPRGFTKINQWPEFANYLNSFYTPIQTRIFRDSAYRIYLRK